MEDIFAHFEQGETKTLNLIVRADMQGTLEPIINSLKELGNDEIDVVILQSAIGDISESDVMLAEASAAVIIGFSVDVDRAAHVRSEASGVEIRRYEIIYKMIEDVEDALKGMLDPIYEDVQDWPSRGASDFQAAPWRDRRLPHFRRYCQAQCPDDSHAQGRTGRNQSAPGDTAQV